MLRQGTDGVPGAPGDKGMDGCKGMPVSGKFHMKTAFLWQVIDLLTQFSRAHPDLLDSRVHQEMMDLLDIR